jgi:hypothetical protein
LEVPAKAAGRKRKIIEKKAFAIKKLFFPSFGGGYQFNQRKYFPPAIP